MPRVIVTGAPGVGKTSLLAELARRGFHTVAESARAVIAERLAQGLAPRPDPLSFALEIYRRDRQSYLGCPPEPACVFFDRCAIESLGMVHEAAPFSEKALQAELSCFAFHRTVYLLPPWEAIYRTDSERDHTFEHALRVHDSLLRWYGRLGYGIEEVPRLPVPQRAQHLLLALGLG